MGEMEAEFLRAAMGGSVWRGNIPNALTQAILEIKL